MSEHVTVDTRDGVLAITLSRPERRNAITVAMYAALASAFEAPATDRSIRLISLRGLGPDFTGGNDLADFLQVMPQGDDVPVWRLLAALARCPVPIVAAVHGNCVGIGTTMLLHCDLVLAEEGARFSLPFVDLGLVPEAASSLLLPQLAGRRRAARYLLLGESFGPEEAREFGLISHVVERGSLEEALGSIVSTLLAKPRDALRLTQSLLRHGAAGAVMDRMELESGHFAERLQSAEVKEAICAFFEKRTPDFTKLPGSDQTER
ncbi:MAG TPA: enoyl-CoA hydratase [Sphingomicrobium sp.]|nr:enoyl-CoA hydratase [Sphingomicrobium sp.]